MGGGASSDNLVNQLQSLITNDVSSKTSTCTMTADMSEQINATNCDIVNSKIDFKQSGLLKGSCATDSTTGITVSQSLLNTVAQSAQATTQGFGLAPANANNTIDQALGSTINVMDYVRDQIASSVTSGETLNCTGGSISGSWISFEQDFGTTVDGIFKNSSVSALQNSLTSEITQVSKATSKDFFGQLADMGSQALIMFTILGTACILAFAYLGGKTVGTATSMVTSLLSSPVFIGGVFLSLAVVNAIMYWKQSFPYKKEVPPQGQQEDPKTAASNKKIFMYSELALGGIGIGVILLFTIFGKLSGGSPAPAQVATPAAK